MADAAIAGASIAEAALSVDPIVITVLERWLNHGAAFEGDELFRCISEHRDAICSADSHDGFQRALSGLIGEQVAATELTALGHQVVLPEATNVPAWDMMIDDKPFQVKTGSTALAQAHESVRLHPDIGIVSTPEVASHFPLAIGTDYLDPSQLKALSSGVDSLEVIASVGSPHIPYVTTFLSVARELGLLASGSTTVIRAAKHISLDVAGTSLGLAGGAKLGLLIASVFTSGPLAAVGAIFGALFGALLGRRTSDYLKSSSHRPVAEARTLAKTVNYMALPRTPAKIINHMSASGCATPLQLIEFKRIESRYVAIRQRIEFKPIESRYVAIRRRIELKAIESRHSAPVPRILKSV